MVARLKMATRSRFGFSKRAQLNVSLVGAVAASGSGCELCAEIQKDVLVNPEGGEYVEAASFTGRTIGTLDAHFKAHWKDDYELVGSSRTDAT
jgi:hypothetical protein